MQSVPITTNVVSSNLDQGEMYNIIDKVCQWLATGRWFSPGPQVSSTNKTDHHNITEILLKVALNTIKQINIKFIVWSVCLSYVGSCFVKIRVMKIKSLRIISRINSKYNYVKHINKIFSYFFLHNCNILHLSKNMLYLCTYICSFG